jgi:hypothetical protein
MNNEVLSKPIDNGSASISTISVLRRCLTTIRKWLSHTKYIELYGAILATTTSFDYDSFICYLGSSGTLHEYCPQGYLHKLDNGGLLIKTIEQ